MVTWLKGRFDEAWAGQEKATLLTTTNDVLIEVGIVLDDDERMINFSSG